MVNFRNFKYLKNFKNFNYTIGFADIDNLYKNVLFCIEKRFLFVYYNIY